MRNRFMAHEVYEEWFEGVMSRAQWNALVLRAPGLQEFRTVMFRRLVPNLKHIGLLTPRMVPRYEQAGLMSFAAGKDATRLSAEEMIADLDSGPSHVPSTPRV